MAVRSTAVIQDQPISKIHEQLARELNLSPKTIEYYESGKVPPNEYVTSFLARSGVRHGLMGKEWLRLFLTTAKHSQLTELIEELFPPEQSQSIRHNIVFKRPFIPFIERSQSNELSSALEGNSGMIVVIGPAGSGKSKLVHEQVRRYVQGNATSKNAFDGVVWIGQPEGPVSLEDMIDTIAQTLGLTILDTFSGNKSERALSLLSSERVLLIIDNAEVGEASQDIYPWLNKLITRGGRAKVLFISREYRDEFETSSCIVVENMTHPEAQRLVRSHLWISGLRRKYPHSQQLTSLIDVADSNPKALITSLNLLKSDIPLSDVMRRLAYQRDPIDGINPAPAWEFLNQASADKDILLALFLFSEPADHKAISATIGVQGDIRSQLERLEAFDLISILGGRGQDRYRLTRQAREDLRMKLNYEPQLEEKLRSNLIEWMTKLCEDVGQPWNRIQELKRLQPEAQTAWKAATWAFENNKFEEAITILTTLDFYWHSIGEWQYYKREGDKLRIKVAEALGRYGLIHEVRAQHVQFLSWQGKLLEVKEEIEKLPRPDEALSDSRLQPNEAIAIVHAHAYYAYYNKNYKEAYKFFNQARDSILYSKSSFRHQIATLRWMGTCTYRQAQEGEGDFTKAEALFREAESLAVEKNDERSQIDCSLHLARITLDRAEHITNKSALTNKAYEFLEKAKAKAENLHEVLSLHEDGYLGQIYLQFTRLYVMEKKHSDAKEAYSGARRLYHRLGIQEDNDVLEGLGKVLEALEKEVQ